MSSRRAWRVRSASVKPNAASRAATASAGQRRARVLGELIEQGAEEEVLVDGPHRGLLAAEVAGQQLAGGGLGRVPVADDPGQAVEGVGLGGQGVDLLLGHQLQPVLDGAQQPVGVVEGPGVVRVDVARLRPARPGRRGWWASAAPGRGGRARAGGAARRTRCRGCRPVPA